MTEQEKYGIEQLSEYLAMQIRIKDGRIKRYKEQMDSDFLYYFAWAGKDLFKEHYIVGKYKELRQILKEAGESRSRAGLSSERTQEMPRKTG